MAPSDNAQEQVISSPDAIQESINIQARVCLFYCFADK